MVSESTIKRILHNISIQWEPKIPSDGHGVLHIDATYEGRDWGVITVIPEKGKSVYYRKILTTHEHVSDYIEAVNAIEKTGYQINGLVLDGFKSLYKIFPQRYPVQMCQFHFKQLMRRHLTKKPKLRAAKDLKKIIELLPDCEQADFEKAVKRWENKWHHFVNERSKGKNDKRSHYKHKKLHAAYSSLCFFLPYLFTYKNVEDMPNTNNKIEGLFTDLKKNFDNHSGIRKENRKRFVDGFFLAWSLPQTTEASQ